MELLKPKATFWGETPTRPSEMLKRIERAGRICYKSEKNITDDSALKFCLSKGVNNSGGDPTKKHFSVLEHSNIVVKWEGTGNLSVDEFTLGLLEVLNAHERIAYHQVRKEEKCVYIGGNLRSWIESDDAVKAHFFNKLLMQPLKSHPILGQFFDGDCATGSEFRLVDNETMPRALRRFTVHFTCDRGVSHELVRHRMMSVSQESTRYCDYKKGLSVIIPPWTGFEPGELTHSNTKIFYPETDGVWLQAMFESESKYRLLREEGWTAQEARSVLPNSLKTELAMTGDLVQWNKLFRLRTHAKTAHPQMVEVAQMAEDWFVG